MKCVVVVMAAAPRPHEISMHNKASLAWTTVHGPPIHPRLPSYIQGALSGKARAPHGSSGAALAQRLLAGAPRCR